MLPLVLMLSALSAALCLVVAYPQQSAPVLVIFGLIYCGVMLADETRSARARLMRRLRTLPSSYRIRRAHRCAAHARTR